MEKIGGRGKRECLHPYVEFLPLSPSFKYENVLISIILQSNNEGI